MQSEIKNIAVLGAGIMGSGIAQIAAAGGYQVILRDLQASLVQKGIQNIERSLQKKIEDCLLSGEERDLILSRITGISDLSEIGGADMVIEAIIENLSVKKQVFAELDSFCSDSAVLATNTSSLSISEIASATKHPERVIGMHFLYPVPVMKITEVVKGIDTSDETVQRTMQVIGNMGKTGILVRRDSPGYVVNRIMAPMLNEAIGVYAEGMASVEDIDTAMKLGAGFPLGMLEFMDRVGLDTVYDSIMVLYNGFRDPKYRPHPLLCTMVGSGHYGRKTGQGFYRYE